MLKQAILVLAILVPAMAAAHDDRRGEGSGDQGKDASVYLVVNMASHHVNAPSEAGFNEFNPGLGFEWRKDRWFGAMGVYRNSYASDAFYFGGGKRWLLHKQGDFRFGVGVGAFAAYTSRKSGGDRGWHALVAPIATMKYKRVGANLLAWPVEYRINGDRGAVIGLQLTFEL